MNVLESLTFPAELILPSANFDITSPKVVNDLLMLLPSNIKES